VPVLTLTGNSFSSRVGTSLNSVALVETELNAFTRKDFLHLGSFLIDIKYKNINNEDNMILRRVRRKIKNCGNLFNSAQFAKYLEIAYKSMYDIANFSHKHIIVTE